MTRLVPPTQFQGKKCSQCHVSVWHRNFFAGKKFVETKSHDGQLVCFICKKQGRASFPPDVLQPPPTNSQFPPTTTATTATLDEGSPSKRMRTRIHHETSVSLQPTISISPCDAVHKTILEVALGGTRAIRELTGSPDCRLASIHIPSEILLDFDCYWFLLNPYLSMSWNATLKIRSRTGEWTLIAAGNGQLPIYLSIVSITQAIRLLTTFVDLLTLFNTSVFCDGLANDPSLSISNIPGGVISSTQRIWSAQCARVIFPSNTGVNSKLCSQCARMHTSLSDSSFETLVDLPSPDQRNNNDDYVHFPPVECVYSQVSLLNEMRKLSDQNFHLRRYSIGFTNSCLRLQSMISSQSYQKIYNSGILPLISPTHLKRKIFEGTRVPLCDGVTAEIAANALKYFQDRFEHEWCQLLKYHPSVIDQKMAQSGTDEIAVRKKSWDSWRTIVLVEEEAAIKQMFLYHQGAVTNPPTPGEENTDPSLGNPAEEAANQVIVHVIRSVGNMNLKFRTSAECCNLTTSSALLASFSRTINILRIAGFIVLSTIYDGAASHKPVSERLFSMYGIRHWSAALKARNGRIFQTPFGCFSMSVFEKAFAFAQSENYTYLHRMGANVLHPNNYEKMNVSLCHSFYCKRMQFSLLHMNDPEATAAAAYLSWVESWWNWISDRRSLTQQSIAQLRTTATDLKETVQIWNRMRLDDLLTRNLVHNTTKRLHAFPSKQLFTDVLTHFDVLEKNFLGVFETMVGHPACQFSFGKLSSDIVEHAIGEARSGTGSMANSTALSMLMHFAKRQRMQIALEETSSMTEDQSNANRSYQGPRQHLQAGKKRAVAFFSVNNAAPIVGEESLDDIISRMREEMSSQLLLESNERCLMTEKCKHVVKQKEYALYAGAGYGFPANNQLFIENQEVSQFVAGAAIRSVLLQKKLLWFFLHRREATSQAALTDVQRAWLQIVGFCCCDMTDPRAQLTTQCSGYDLTRAEAWARKPDENGARKTSFLFFIEKKENSLLRITNGFYHNFIRPITQIITGERQHGVIFLNRRAMTVRLLLDTNIKAGFEQYLQKASFTLPLGLTQADFDEISDEFRRRLIVELEYKMIGELGTKLNNALKKSNSGSDTTTAPVRSGASPRQNIAQTSRQQSSGHLVR